MIKDVETTTAFGTVGTEIKLSALDEKKFVRCELNIPVLLLVIN